MCTLDFFGNFNQIGPLVCEKRVIINLRFFERICPLLVIITDDTATNLNVKSPLQHFDKIFKEILAQVLHAPLDGART